MEKNKSIAPVLNIKSILKALGAAEGTAVYSSVLQRCEELMPKICDAVNLRRNIAADDKKIYVIITAGEKITDLSDELFQNGDGLGGIIVSVAADEEIFNADLTASEKIKYFCAEKGKGIKRRLEAPGDIPYTEQKTILEKTGANTVSLTEKMMFSPVKTMAYELELSDDDSLFASQHDCSKCPNLNCVRRSVPPKGQYDIVCGFDYKPFNTNGTAIDIGTTTIAAVKFRDGKTEKVYTAPNPQRTFGADVLSRIEAANGGKREELTKLIRDKIDECISYLGSERDRIIIAANTVMSSLYHGYDCSQLGVYPFKAQSLETVRNDNTIILGGISGFVGGDIVSGLYMCGFADSDEINMLVDLGTNGEIAIGCRDRIICTSAPAGPAFEGGGISCGSAAAGGAVCAVSLKDGKIETVSGKEPDGICGSGIIDLIAGFVETGIIDETGLLDRKYGGKYSLTDNVFVSQHDIRQIQTAKSAVRTGIEILIKEYGADESDIKNIYVSGGFSKRLNFDSACTVGLLPKRFKDRFRAIGNSSLGGCVKLLDNECSLRGVDIIRTVSEDFSLAQHPKFTEMFVKYMGF